MVTIDGMAGEQPYRLVIDGGHWRLLLGGGGDPAEFEQWTSVYEYATGTGDDPDAILAEHLPRVA